MVLCMNCRRFGHLAAACPTKTAYTEEQLVDVRCLLCGEHGHLNCAVVKTRALRLFCYNCGQRGHFGEDCHRPGMDPTVQRRIATASHAMHRAGGPIGGSPFRAGGDRFRRHSSEPLAAATGKKRAFDELAEVNAFFGDRADGSTPTARSSRMHTGGQRSSTPHSAPARVRHEIDTSRRGERGQRPPGSGGRGTVKGPRKQEHARKSDIKHSARKSGKKGKGRANCKY
jgi:hypothetical protein